MNGHTNGKGEAYKATTAAYKWLFQGRVVSRRQIATEHPMLGVSIGQLINLGVVQVNGTTSTEEHGSDVELVKVDERHHLNGKTHRERMLEVDRENPLGHEGGFGVTYEAMQQ